MGLFVECLDKPNHPKHFLVIPLVITLIIGFVSMFTILKYYLTNRTGRNKNLLSGTCSSPPVVPGLPLLGNLLQLKDKITHHIFANWAEIYGPIYSIKAGASNIVVLNSTDVAKEAMVTKFSFISKRKQTNAMNKLTNNIIITSDSNEYHKMARRHVVTHMLGSGAQRRHRAHRDIMIDNVVNGLHAHAKENPVDQPVNFRRILQTEIFGLSLKQALGVDSVGSSKYIEGLGETLSRDEIFKVLVLDPLSGGAEVDWRDFFPYLRWVPNKSFEMHIGLMETRRLKVMKTLIEEQQKRISSGKRRHRAQRDIMIDNVVNGLHAHAKEDPVDQPVNFRRILQTEIFGLALKQALGVDSVGSSKYIEGLGETLSRDEIFKVLVLDPISGGAEVDWRDFFPYLRWVPNKSFEMHIGRMETRRLEVMKTLTEEQQTRISSGKEINCYLDRLMSAEGKTLAKTHLTMLIWETILVASETTVDTAELVMYELAKNPKCQDHLYREIQKVCGNNKYTEEQFSGVTYLSAVFHETLRRHPPFPVSPLRYVHEDTQLGGYDIPAGTEIAINLYGCNMEKRQWDSPEEWKPERFLDSKYDPKDLYKTMSFGGGKRVCPGALQGLSITCTAIARCIQDFKWSLKPGREEDDINTATPTCQKLNPLLVIVTPRDY